MGVLWCLAWDDGSGSFGSCGLLGGALVDQTCSGTNCRCSVGMEPGEFGGQIDTLSFLLYSFICSAEGN